MTERLLQYIWQFQYFNTTSLYTTEGQLLQIIHPGMYNTNQGPDFINAKIKVNDTTWAGSIELHIRSGDWNIHQHDTDKNYNNVILHVVWDDDVNLQVSFPTLVLQNIVSKLLLNKYVELMHGRRFIACEKHISAVDELTLLKWKERLLIERLQQKTVFIETLQKKNNNHWEETFWWMLARNFGTKINAEVFERVAQSLTVNLLAKHRNQLIQLEALLMGQMGLLDKDFADSYPIMLKKEYRFLQKKYDLRSVLHPLYFLRMRPANFPTIRLAQLAALIHNSSSLFSSIKEMNDYNEVKKLFNVTANDYWHYHYVFDETTAFKRKTVGKEMTENIMINTIIPVLYAYGYVQNKESYQLKALKWMQQLSAEKNSITNGFASLGIENKTAFDSQALIQLKNNYCDKKYCLQCAIGNKILKTENNI